MPCLCDAHAHLASPQLLPSLSTLLPRLEADGVQRILTNATRPGDWDDTLRLVERDRILAAIGVHPFFCDEWNPSAEERLLTLAQTKNVAAIGEIGLDGAKGDVALQRQLPVFRRQLEIAVEHSLPVNLHLVKAWPYFWNVIKELKITKLRGCVHSFTASMEIAQALMKLGLHLSYGKYVRNPQALNCRITARTIPLDRILTETDCPDMDATPGDASSTLTTISLLRELPEDVMSGIILNNFRAAFE